MEFGLMFANTGPFAKPEGAKAVGQAAEAAGLYHAGAPRTAVITAGTGSPGAGLVEGLQRYLAFYVLTSLWWDAMRSVGNAVLLALFGPALVTILRRYQRRFHFVLA